MSKKFRIVITVWKGLVDSVTSDIPIDADILVVDRDSDKTEFQELEIEVNPEKVSQSYAEAEKFWEEEEDNAGRPVFPMECDVPVFEGCGRLLAAAKQVISKWEHGDLAAAVRHLDLCIKEIEGKVTEKPRDVILLIIETRNGRNFYACEDSDRAIDELYEFIEEYWHELPDEVGTIPSNKLDAIEIYYREKDGKESYEMQALPLLSARPEVS